MNILIKCLSFLSLSVLLNSEALSLEKESFQSYDEISITPKTWKEVDLIYSDIINGKSYPGVLKLIRPITWLKKEGLIDQKNQAVKKSPIIISIPAFGIDHVNARIKAVKSIDFNFSVHMSHAVRPVIALSKRYTTDIGIYTFYDESGRVITLHATPNHPVYVQNRVIRKKLTNEKSHYIPIGQLLTSDQVLSSENKTLSLIKKSKFTESDAPIRVYNFEVYQKHRYFVSDVHHDSAHWPVNILVHNGGCDIEDEAAIRQFNEDVNNSGKVGAQDFRLNRDLDSQRLNVAAHGNISLIQSLQGESVVASKFAKQLRHYGISTKEQPVELKSCGTGYFSCGFGQQLANELNVKVLAPAEKVNEFALASDFKSFYPQFGLKKKVTQVVGSFENKLGKGHLYFKRMKRWIFNY